MLSAPSWRPSSLSKTEGDARAGREPLFQRGQEPGRQRRQRSSGSATARQVAFQALPLFGRIAELAVAVGELDAADVGLEALSSAGIGSIQPRHGRLGGGVVEDDRHAVGRKLRFDPFAEQPGEQVVPVQAAGVDR